MLLLSNRNCDRLKAGEIFRINKSALVQSAGFRTVNLLLGPRRVL